MPTASVPPLTPGTTQKMSQALQASFKSFEKEQAMHGIPKGEREHTGGFYEEIYTH